MNWLLGVRMPPKPKVPFTLAALPLIQHLLKLNPRSAAGMVPEMQSVTHLFFLSFWTIFLHFYPPNNPKNQNFEKMKKPPGDIITLHMCTINDNHIMYEKLKTEKEVWRYHHFTQMYQKS